MGFYTHNWAESHGGINDVGREASKQIEAELARRAEAAAAVPTSGQRDYGEAAFHTGAALLETTPVPGTIVQGFLDVLKSIFHSQ